jgi:NADP-reducing hydrogenase subunit HndB
MKSIQELNAIREKMQGLSKDRTVADEGTIRIVVGMATCGIAAGARPVLNALVEEVAKRNLQHVVVSQTGCIGMCKLEPIVEVFVPGHEKVTYVHMTAEKAVRVIAEHIVNNKPVKEFAVEEK